MDRIDVKNIFAAVSNKSILDPLLDVLDKKSVKFWGTERTVKYLKLKGFRAISIVSGFDFAGRIKTLQKEVFARILADRSKKKHMEALKLLARDTSEVGPPRLASGEAGPDSSKVEDFALFDLVIVDLYPSDSKNFPQSMDIGGQALIRAAIKNYKNVALIYDAKSLENFVNHFEDNHGLISIAFRKKQAKAAAKFIAKRCNLEAKYFK